MSNSLPQYGAKSKIGWLALPLGSAEEPAYFTSAQTDELVDSPKQLISRLNIRGD